MKHRLNSFLTLIRRECLRFASLAMQTLAPPIISTVLFILIFGYSLGSRIESVYHFSYILFILPGLTAMGIMMNAFQNSSTSLFMARYDMSIENILVAPVSHLQIVLSYIIGGALRGVVIGLITLGVGLIMTDLSIHSVMGSLLYMILTAVFFSSLGFLSGLMAEQWDHIATFMNFVITPFIYLGGVFYSIEMLPPFWQKVSLFNPVFYLVDGFRGELLGLAEAPRFLSLSVLLGMVLSTFALSLYLIHRGWKLIR